MAKNAKGAERQVKARQTKLSKKTNEELIEIILRKDKTERSLNSQVVALKSEVNTLTSRVNNFDKDQEGNIKAINDWKERYYEAYNLVNNLNTKIASLNSRIDCITKDVKDYDTNYELVCKNLHKTVKKLNKYRLISWILICVLSFLMLFS